MKDLEELPRTAELRSRIEKQSAAEFVKSAPGPALHLTLRVQSKTGRIDARDGEKSPQERSYERTAVIPPTGQSVQRYNDRVAFLAKRAGNPFPNMISVGRALNNDLVVVLSTVSKLHGYFMNDGKTWLYVDHGSKNGTKVNDQPVSRNERRPLASGDRIALGLELQAVFFLPEALYDFLRRSSSGALP